MERSPAPKVLRQGGCRLAIQARFCRHSCRRVPGRSDQLFGGETPDYLCRRRGFAREPLIAIREVLICGRGLRFQVRAHRAGIVCECYVGCRRNCEEHDQSGKQCQSVFNFPGVHRLYLVCEHRLLRHVKLVTSLYCTSRANLKKPCKTNIYRKTHSHDISLITEYRDRFHGFSYILTK